MIDARKGSQRRQGSGCGSTLGILYLEHAHSPRPELLDKESSQKRYHFEASKQFEAIRCRIKVKVWSWAKFGTSLGSGLCVWLQAKTLEDRVY